MSSNPFYTFKNKESLPKEKYDTFTVTRKGHIIHLELCRPQEFNSADFNHYDDFVHFFNTVSYERDVRCIVMTAAGKHFCAGLDLKRTAGETMVFDDDQDQARRSLELEKRVIQMQNAYTAIEKCRWPVIAGVHGGCIGTGVDMITDCDVVFCTKSAFFLSKRSTMP